MSNTITCGGARHVFVEATMGSVPFCNCGMVRNQMYRRTFWQRLLGLPKTNMK